MPGTRGTRANSSPAIVPENWHFKSRFVLKTTKTSVFVFITEILNELFEVIKDDLFVFDVAKNLY